MSWTVRRIVTATHPTGRSFIDSDSAVPAGNGAVELWQTAPSASGAVPFHPAPGGSLLRIIELQPASGPADRAAQDSLAASVFAALGASHCRVDTGRDAWMHVTPTIDYVLVMAGAVRLIVDEGEPLHLDAGSVVIQNGANHAWHAVGPGCARLLVVMNGSTENPVA